MKFGLQEMAFAAVMLGLLGSSYFLVFNKANQKRVALQAEIDRKTKELADLNRSTAGAGEMKAKVERVQQAVSYFEEKLPREREIAEFVRNVSRLAAANHLRTSTLKSDKSQQGDNYSEQMIDLGFGGDFKHFYKFLQEVERLARLHRVTKMSLSKINDREGEMEAQMTMCIFYEPGAPAAGGGAAGQGAVADTR